MGACAQSAAWAAALALVGSKGVPEAGVRCAPSLDWTITGRTNGFSAYMQHLVLVVHSCCVSCICIKAVFGVGGRRTTG